MAELADGDEQLARELLREADRLRSQIADERLAAWLADERHRRSALISITAGAGGIESQSWAAELLRMYSRWAKRRGYGVELLDVMEGEQAGIRSATLEVSGKHAYGWLRLESGVHRRQRSSPFDRRGRRHTSFAAVEVAPRYAEDEQDPEIASSEIKVETMRSGGKGGQNVNKTETAVRVTHLPTGITAYQASRSQAQNREVALSILRGRVRAQREKERAAALELDRAQRRPTEFASQIRSWMFEPSQMVKDHRSGYQTTKLVQVLEGDLDELLRSNIAALAD